MRLMFVHHVIEDRGSAQDMYNYTQVASTLGHEVTLYGPPNDRSLFNYSLDIGSADAIIFIFEWTTNLQYGDLLDVARLVGKVSRHRRIVIDCDGKYNEAFSVVGDVNHADADASRRWIEVCDSLSDRIYQPTLHPLRPNVQTFFFHAYDPAWETPLDFSAKQYGMVYVGNNWFRWRALERVLRAIEPVREKLRPIGLVGNGWDAPAPWANPTLTEDAYHTDPAYLEQMGVEVSPPVRFDQVIRTMGMGAFTPVIYRPLFDRLRFVTCRTFETPAANTIPLFAQEAAFVEEIYGERAVEMVLPEVRPEEKLLDLLSRPEHYAEIIMGIRRSLAENHSYAARLQQLIEILES